MNYEDAFLQHARNAARMCASRGRETTTWSDGRGTSVTGWSIHHDTRPITTRGNPHVPGGWFEESWGFSELILATDGSLWDYSQDGYEGTDYQGGFRIDRYLHEAGTARFVGKQGEPFSEWTSKLQRLPYA